MDRIQVVSWLCQVLQTAPFFQTSASVLLAGAIASNADTSGFSGFAPLKAFDSFIYFLIHLKQFDILLAQIEFRRRARFNLKLGLTTHFWLDRRLTSTAFGYNFFGHGVLPLLSLR